MKNNIPIKIAQEKLLELKTALFFPDSNSPVKIPSNVITAERLNEMGQIWFTISRPPSSKKKRIRISLVGLSSIGKARVFI